MVLITGGNIGDVEPRLRKAQNLIGCEIGPVIRCSRFYGSRAWGFAAEEPFVNQVLAVDTELTPRGVLGKILEIERTLGRERCAEEAEKARTGQRYCSRVIDVDILFYDDLVMDEPDLKIPHPLLHERDFVLEPLCEVAPEKVHPVLGKTAAELWNSRRRAAEQENRETEGKK